MLEDNILYYEEIQRMETQEVLQKIREEISTEQSRIWKAQGLDLLWPFGSHQENAHSAVIAYLLGNPEYFKSFLSCIKLGHIDFQKDSVEIITEHPTDNNRRIDIFITLNENTCIIIENKIYAQDQVAQLHDYYSYAKEVKKFKNIYTFYLTLDGKAPSEASLVDLSRDTVSLICYGHHILPWIYSIYKSLEYTNNSNNLKDDLEKIFTPELFQDNVLKSALEQYMVALGDLLNMRGINDQTQKHILGILKVSSKENIYELIKICTEFPNDVPAELCRMKNILKCLDVHSRFGGTLIASSHNDINECNKEASMGAFDEKTPYFSGVLSKEKNLSIIFLNDGNDQYQIGRFKNGNWFFDYQGYGLNYQYQFETFLKK